MNYIYTGVFFDKDSLHEVVNKYLNISMLERVIENPHVTFEYKPAKVDESLFGLPIKFAVTGYGYNGKNQGLLVEPVLIWTALEGTFKKIKMPHITLSVSVDGKPVDTGNLTFVKIRHRFFICGRYGAYNGNREVVINNPQNNKKYELQKMNA